MINELPKISVLMPAYNTEKYIGEAIESVLNQTFKDFEFIIIDDGSTDRTWEVIQEYAKKDRRIIVLRNEENLKICKTLNRGIEIAKGNYIARMDADDWSYPDRLQKQLVFMEAHPDVVISGGTMEVCDKQLQAKNRRGYNLTDDTIREKLFRYSPFCHPTTIYRTDVARKVGGYNEMYHPADDYEFYFRMGLEGKFGNIHDAVLKYRVIANSMTTGGMKKMETETIVIRKKYSSLYHAKLLDKLYNLLHSILIHITPTTIRMRIFNFIRSLTT